MLFLAIIGGTVGIVAVMVGSALWRGYVLSTLWGWFVVPLFGLPKLAIAPAIGLSLVVGFLTYQTPPDVEERKRDGVDKWVRIVVLAALLPALSLGMGWIVHWYMAR